MSAGVKNADPVVVGRFGRTFGVSGWIRVISFTEPEENILDFRPWLVQRNGVWEEINTTESKKRVKDIIVKLPGYDSPESVSILTNVKIAVRRDRLPLLQSKEYYWHDLVGLKVVNQDELVLGTVKDLMATGANDVLVVEGKKRCLIPYISNVVLDVDLSNKTIRVDWDPNYL